jgi:PhnB protein
MATADNSGSGDVRAVPEGYATVTPWVISRDTGRLIAFMTRAFDAKEIARVVDEHGVIGHAEVRIGDSVVMGFDARPDWPDTPAFLRLYAADCDVVYQRALSSGAASVTRPTTLFFGDRVARVRDPLGNLWWIQTRLENLTMEEMERRAALPEYLAAMEYVTGAQFFPPADDPRPGVMV